MRRTSSQVRRHEEPGFSRFEGVVLLGGVLPATSLVPSACLQHVRLLRPLCLRASLLNARVRYALQRGAAKQLGRALCGWILLPIDGETGASGFDSPL